MANLDLNKATYSTYSGLDAYAMPQMSVDGIRDQEETTWQNTSWSEYWGWFNQNPKVKNAILMKAIWNVGKGWKADTHTTNILKNISGNGKQTFRDILFSLDCTKRIGGDAYAEILTHNGKKISEGGILVNLKLLDPGSMKEIYDRKGRLIRYEQINTIKGVLNTWEPGEIFHLSNNRMAGQIHGISDLEALRKVILADGKSFDDLLKIVSFQAKPFIVFKLKTDDEAKINTFVAKIKKARELGEDMFIPDDENLLSYEVVQVNPSSILMDWRTDLRNEYYRCIGLPQIIPGAGGQGTESESKVIYVAFEQIVMNDQMDIEEALFQQLKLEVNLIHPTLIEDLLGTDMKKDGANVMNVQPSELNPMAQNQS